MTGRIINNLIEVRQRDSFLINISLERDGKPVDLTGSRLKMQVRDDDDNLIFSLDGINVDAASGKMALALTPEQTNNPTGNYKTDIRMTGPDGSVNTIFPAHPGQVGTFRITAQVTEE
ncbi:MAG: BppU family phage baseplate upper protein [Alphaproteobacteria bacterium]